MPIDVGTVNGWINREQRFGEQRLRVPDVAIEKSDRIPNSCSTFLGMTARLELLAKSSAEIWW
ncbi:MAG: hypothetical protein ACK5Q5_03900 [Planctomycetaceae bacterium]